MDDAPRFTGPGGPARSHASRPRPCCNAFPGKGLRVTSREVSASQRMVPAVGRPGKGRRLHSPPALVCLPSGECVLRLHGPIVDSHIVDQAGPERRWRKILARANVQAAARWRQVGLRVSGDLNAIHL